MNKKVAVIGDTHGSLSAVAWGLKKVRPQGVMFSVGDFGIWSGTKGTAFLDDVSTICVRDKKSVYIVPGNHDDYDIIDSLKFNDRGVAQLRPRVFVLDRGAIVKKHGITIAGFGGATSIDGPNGIWTQTRWPGFGWWAREDISEGDYINAVKYYEAWDGDIDVMVSHDSPMNNEGLNKKYPPYGASLPNRMYLQAYADMVRPAFCIFGHYHDVHTSVVNYMDGQYSRAILLNAADISREGALGFVQRHDQTWRQLFFTREDTGQSFYWGHPR